MANSLVIGKIYNLKFNELLVRLPYLLDQSNNFFLTDLKEEVISLSISSG